MSTTDAATLVRFALDRRASSFNDPEHRELRARLGDEGFRVEVHHVADGLGLEVLYAGPSGLLLSARTDSPFAPRLEDYPLTVRSAADRLCHGLIHVAVGALAYPRADDLEDRDRVIRLTVHDVDAHLWQMAERRAEDHAGTDVPVADLTLEPAWAAWKRQRRAGQTQDGRAHPRTTRRWVEVAFDWLVEHDLAQRVGEEGGGTYRLNRAHRALVAEVTSQRLVEALRQADDRVG